MNQGFTLIELLVVVLIIGILSAVALPQYQTAVERSRATEALTQMNAVRTAAERYHSQHEAWPNSFNKLDVEIPAKASCSSGFGGKNFCLSFYLKGDDCSSDFCVKALRSRDSHSYTLQTNIDEQADGTYASNRYCYIVTTGDQEATDYCNAISGGKSTAGF